ncbi:hypothetical protein CHS0354_030454 [Potamilus streckersoni]|uniref:Uncharacterized protein n=1 Tax=Potamilus streckersoni TaxID=2493646 RepID=A0AAE0T1J4_9BIVA|nr:hypothetical protein CHS0354_030454 [Potamilus streckersoni]
MAEDIRGPHAVTSEEIDVDTVRVVLIIPGLEVEKRFLGSAHPKKGTVVDVQFGDSTLEVKADVKDKKGQVIKYEFKVCQLPGLINKDKCKTEYKKEQIILTLVKNEDFRNSWAVVLSKNGLEQAADD